MTTLLQFGVKLPEDINNLFNLDILGDDLEEWLEETSILKEVLDLLQ